MTRSNDLGTAQRWLIPLLAVLPALGMAVWGGMSGEAREVEPIPLGSIPAAPLVEPALDSMTAPEPYPGEILERDGIVGQIASRRDLPDSIGVLMERRLSARSGSIEDYLLWLPPGLERGGRAWPVILYLHGRSLRGDDPSMLLRYGLPRYLAEGRSIPFIVVAPQLHTPGSWTDVDRLAAILDQVEARYSVDRDRVYLTGYSMGGGGVWRMALEHADRFAAAVPMAAHTPEPTAVWARAVAELPIRVIHGAEDESAPPAAARTMVEFLRRTGADAELRMVEGADHGDLTTVYRDPSLYDWMLEHRRR
ncbi:MAG TPA: alpha/beta fold hydrolase [Gemmatimonadota bacterium]|nr:alpha/beta fold hydrolase [Gemmatimonadota bacterium]